MHNCCCQLERSVRQSLKQMLERFGRWLQVKSPVHSLSISVIRVDRSNSPEQSVLCIVYVLRYIHVAKKYKQNNVFFSYEQMTAKSSFPSCLQERNVSLLSAFSHLPAIPECCNDFFCNIHYLCACGTRGRATAAAQSVQSLKLEKLTDDGKVVTVDQIASHQAVI